MNSIKRTTVKNVLRRTKNNIGQRLITLLLKSVHTYVMMMVAHGFAKALMLKEHVVYCKPGLLEQFLRMKKRKGVEENMHDISHFTDLRTQLQHDYDQEEDMNIESEHFSANQDNPL
ncbi:hypothetical protein AKJ16_DCAP04660 [Drosera capensis]